MHDTLADGTKLRNFNVINDFNREALNITLDRSINGTGTRQAHRVAAQAREAKGGQRPGVHRHRTGTMV